ncbi:MAG: hypothetical protein JST01_27745 [Cyanobacteria bacterium SZAS TMP-1]|nr:hypothetical protein [Cyanobacteria bacterium SZAS TMP-1]
MSFDSLKSTIEDNLNPVDFARGFANGAFNRPLSAIEQLAGKQLEQQPQKSETLATKAGVIAGSVVDLVIVAKASGAALGPLLGKAAETTLGQTSKMFAAGAITGGIFTPSESSENLLSDRLKNGLISGTTFAVMGGVSKTLEGTELLGGKTLLSKVGTNAVGGMAGGVVEAYGGTALKEHRLATSGEVLSSAAQYTAMGAAFGALDHGMSVGGARLAKIPAVENAYWRSHRVLGESQTEARRLTYAGLNKLGLSHPMQTIGDWIYGTKIIDNAPKAPLTQANNPAAALEKELPQYFAKIKELEETPRGQKDREIYDEIIAEQTRFAHRLITLLHGTPEQPGIAQHSDAALATAEMPAERIAAMRKTLMSSAKVDGDSSPLTAGLAELAGFKAEGRELRKYELNMVGSIFKAKGLHYGYSDEEVMKRMSMPSQLYQYRRAYGVPVDWTPFKATEQLPNFFHGTVSSSLPSIFTERALLPSAELRLRGIKQVAGESAQQEFPRRAISFTTDFNEAWVYHRHSPEDLVNFPVVLGISSRVAARAYPAGMLEPGELLVDKLRIGTSPLNRLGLRIPDVTHIYVPDPLIDLVNQTLARYRVRGVQVVGLNQLEKPQWTPLTPEQLERFY